MSEKEDKRRIHAMIVEAYAMLSGPPGPRPYDSVKRYYHEDARLVRTGIAGEGRGVNFFNLVKSGDEWIIMSIVWDNERPGLSLPDFA